MSTPSRRPDTGKVLILVLAALACRLAVWIDRMLLDQPEVAILFGWTAVILEVAAAALLLAHYEPDDTGPRPQP